jgi:hypothetical protein
VQDELFRLGVAISQLGFGQFYFFSGIRQYLNIILDVDFYVLN